MQYIPIPTRILQPPQDDLFAVLDETLSDLRPTDVLLVSSKVVAIHEGRCVSVDEFDLAKHIANEADVVIKRDNWSSPLTIINHVMVGRAGVDRSNSNGYITMLPQNPFKSAQAIYQHVKARLGFSQFGVIITDSHSVPCRYGAVGGAIGFWGIKPLVSHIGKPDLFGRKIKVERTNMVDGIAAGANLVMGEVAECTPLVIARDVPNIRFEEGLLRDELFCPFADDVMRVLYKDFLT